MKERLRSQIYALFTKGLSALIKPISAYPGGLLRACALPRRDVSVARRFILLHHSARDTFEPFSQANISP